MTYKKALIKDFDVVKTPDLNISLYNLSSNTTLDD